MPWCNRNVSVEYKKGITECVQIVGRLVGWNSRDESQRKRYINMKQCLEEETEEQTQQQKQPSAGVYQDKKAKAEDFKKLCLYTLLLWGILGIAALVLIEIGGAPYSFGTG